LLITETTALKRVVREFDQIGEWQNILFGGRFLFKIIFTEKPVCTGILFEGIIILNKEM